MSILSPVKPNVYTAGITSDQLEARGRTFSFADDGLVSRHGKDKRAIIDSVHEELNRLGNWCNESKCRNHPDKACVLWCSLNIRAVKATMPTVSIDGK